MQSLWNATKRYPLRQNTIKHSGKWKVAHKRKVFSNSVFLLCASGVVLNAWPIYSISGWNNQRAEQWQTHWLTQAKSCFILPPRQQVDRYSGQGWALPFTNYTCSFKQPQLNNEIKFEYHSRQKACLLPDCYQLPCCFNPYSKPWSCQQLCWTTWASLATILKRFKLIFQFWLFLKKKSASDIKRERQQN